MKNLFLYQIQLNRILISLCSVQIKKIERVLNDYIKGTETSI